mmetsp:Transcript_2475/g.3930  ORF Transcript_2475/g.3930 Transcript_2475/m.3930 type:complete len:222 (+) Transcript_2475:437-1102(+)
MTFQESSQGMSQGISLVPRVKPTKPEKAEARHPQSERPRPRALSWDKVMRSGSCRAPMLKLTGALTGGRLLPSASRPSEAQSVWARGISWCRTWEAQQMTMSGSLLQVAAFANPRRTLKSTMRSMTLRPVHRKRDRRKEVEMAQGLGEKTEGGRRDPQAMALQDIPKRSRPSPKWLLPWGGESMARATGGKTGGIMITNAKTLFVVTLLAGVEVVPMVLAG